MLVHDYINVIIYYLCKDICSPGNEDGLLTPNSTIDSITAEFTKKIILQQNRQLVDDNSHSGSVESIIESDKHSKTSSLDRRYVGMDQSKRSSLDSEKMKSRYFSCAELVDELNVDPKLKRDDSIRSSLRSTRSRMRSPRRPDSHVSQESSTKIDEDENKVEESRVCEAKMNPPQSPPITRISKSESISSLSSEMSSIASSASAMARKVKGFKQVIKSKFTKFRRVESTKTITDDASSEISRKSDSSGQLKIKTSRHMLNSKRQLNLPLADLKIQQELSQNSKSEPIYVLKFNADGQLLAAGGKECHVSIWVLNTAREKYNATDLPESGDLFCPVPLRQFFGHSADILDLAWSEQIGENWLLSASKDSTACLWHVSKAEPLLVFKHPEAVKCLCFYPKHQKYFASGSVDGVVRFWDIMAEETAYEVQVQPRVKNGELITAILFVRNGEWLIVGTFDGRCIIYEQEKLNYYTEIPVSDKPVTGIETIDQNILVTTGDSRIKIFSLDSLQMTSRFKGFTIRERFVISAVYSSANRLICCGSEDGATYCWPVSNDRQDKDSKWQSYKIHNTFINAVAIPNLQFSSPLIIATGDEVGRISIVSN